MVYIYFFKVFLFGFEKRWSRPLGMFNSHLGHVSRCVRNIFQAVTPVTSKQRSPLCLLIMQKDAFEVFSLLPFIVWELLSPAQKGQELVPGQSNTGVWGKTGPLSTQARPPGSQAQLPGPQSEQGSRFRICQCLEFSGLHAFCQARAQLCLPATWLHGTAFAPDLRHAEGKEYYIRFFLKVMDKITTPVAENWDPYQVSMKEIMTETKDKCSTLFRASENFPWYGSAARVGSDNYSLDTHTLSGRNSVFIIHFRVFSCTSSP